MSLICMISTVHIFCSREGHTISKPVNQHHMRKLLLLFCLLFFAVASQAQSCKQFWKQYQAAPDSIQQLELLNQYIGLGCEDNIQSAYLERGKLHAASGSFGLADEDFMKAVQINPTSPEGWYQSAKLMYSLMTLQNDMGLEATLYINKAIAIDSLNARYYMLRGDILGALFSHENSLKDYERSIVLLNKEEPKDTTALVKSHCAIGGTLQAMSVLQTEEASKAALVNKAIAQLKQALALDSMFYNAYFLLGNAFFYKEDYESSISAFERCKELNPAHANVAQNLAITYRVAGKYQGEQKHNLAKALEYLDKSFQLNPKDAETLRLLGIANAIGGNLSQALDWFLQGVALDPNHAGLWWDLSMTYGNLGEREKMKECKQKALEIDPDIERKKKK